jgi:curli biogenesis system outer membrane secretion channel CsgG
MKFFKIVLSISLLTFSFEVFAQSNKPVIGIGDMQSSVGGDVNTFRAMLETALANTNKFELIERSRIGDLISEQALSAGGITEGSGQIGGISGVDYLVYGSITKLGVESNEFNLGDYKSASQDGVMSVDLRVVDVSTGSIKISETVEVESSVSSAINIDGRSIGGDEADPLSSVQRVAAVQIAGKIALNIFPIKVINVKDNMVYLNYGSSILSKCSWSSSESCYLKIVELGEGFVDPDTGEVLGAEEEYVGAVEITEPKSKFTIAKILEGNITRGAIAVQMSKSDGNKIKKKIKANKKKKRR